MNVLSALIGSDTVSLKRWFVTEKFSKLFVLVIFTVLFLSLSFFIFIVSSTFFRNLFSFEQFGLLTANYIIHAVIFLVLWLSIASSIVAALSFLAVQNTSRDYITTLPVPSMDYSLWLFFRTGCLNIFLLFIILFPITVSYEKIFAGVISAAYILKIVFLIITLVCVSSATGSWVAYYLAQYVKDKQMYVMVIGMSFFFLASFVLLKIIFPPALVELYNATPEYFQTFFYQLPLMKWFVPTKLVVDTYILGFGMHSVYWMIAVGTLVVLSLRFQSKKVFGLLAQLREERLKAIDVENSALIKRSGQIGALLIKDWYVFIRSSQEVGYAVFLLAIVLFFFFFLAQATRIGQIDKTYANDLLLFSFDWLIFFATAYFLRLIFPLMAKEGPSFWYIFSLPIDRKKILHGKIIMSLIFSVPLVAISLFLWWWHPVDFSIKPQFLLISILGILLLAVLHGILGALYPNFREGSDPEKVSTSSMGVITLFISFFIAVGFHVILRWLIGGELSFLTALGLISLTGIALTVILYTFTLPKLPRVS